jgi:shikimate kinase
VCQGEFATGNSVFIKHLANQVTANGQAMLNAVVSLQRELEKTSQRLEVSEDKSTSLQQEKEVLQKELNEARAAHNAQVAIHSLSPRSICADHFTDAGSRNAHFFRGHHSVDTLTCDGSALAHRHNAM